MVESIDVEPRRENSVVWSDLSYECASREITEEVITALKEELIEAWQSGGKEGSGFNIQ